MLRIPARHGHYIFGVLQSGLTCAVASAISSSSLTVEEGFLTHWLRSWLVSWTTMLPIVLLAAPYIRRIANLVTREETS